MKRIKIFLVCLVLAIILVTTHTQARWKQLKFENIRIQDSADFDFIERKGDFFLIQKEHPVMVWELNEYYIRPLWLRNYLKAMRKGQFE